MTSSPYPPWIFKIFIPQGACRVPKLWSSWYLQGFPSLGWDGLRDGKKSGNSLRTLHTSKNARATGLTMGSWQLPVEYIELSSNFTELQLGALHLYKKLGSLTSIYFPSTLSYPGPNIYSCGSRALLQYSLGAPKSRTPMIFWNFVGFYDVILINLFSTSEVG